MRAGSNVSNKILTWKELASRIAQWRVLGKTIAFTNGCFDIVHVGHIASLNEAAKHADYLIVGLNADASVKGLKGPGRPINNEVNRAILLASLAVVDAIVIFSEPTPIELIRLVQPDFLVKGGDYKIEEVVGAKEVMERGGQVIINPTVEGFSTTSIIQKLQQS